jgi:2-oxoglutarate ferredoxin oxidoreductase subunit beta
VRPGAFVFTYQGDGDLAAIGTAEIVHAAARGERISVVFVNNGIYGMTGGQMAPTTLLGQRTTSSPAGRDARTAGYPVLITEMLALLPGVAYAARGSVADPGHIGKTKAMLRTAFQAQLDDRGFSIVEVLSNCPVGWGMTAPESMAHLAEVSETYPLGVLVDRSKEGGWWNEPSSSPASAARDCSSRVRSWPAPPSATGSRPSGSPPTVRRCEAAPPPAPSS